MNSDRNLTLYNSQLHTKYKSGQFDFIKDDNNSGNLTGRNVHCVFTSVRSDYVIHELYSRLISSNNLCYSNGNFMNDYRLTNIQEDPQQKTIHQNRE